MTVIDIDTERSDNDKNSIVFVRCKCSCGNEKTVRLSYLKNGHTTSCGCYQKKVARNYYLKDITGQQFGRLTALHRMNGTSKGRKTSWVCKCECGNIAVVRTTNLMSGNTRSCGCLISKNEEKIRELLIKHNVNFKTQFSFNDLRNPDTNTLLRFDFAIFDKDWNLNMLIEYDGKQHFMQSGYSSDLEQNKKKLAVLQKCDRLKDDYCEQNGFSLFRINYKYEDDIGKLILGALKEKGVI